MACEMPIPHDRVQLGTPSAITSEWWHGDVFADVQSESQLIARSDGSKHICGAVVPPTGSCHASGSRGKQPVMVQPPCLPRFDAWPRAAFLGSDGMEFEDCGDTLEALPGRQSTYSGYGVTYGHSVASEVPASLRARGTSAPGTKAGRGEGGGQRHKGGALLSAMAVSSSSRSDVDSEPPALDLDNWASLGAALAAAVQAAGAEKASLDRKIIESTEQTQQEGSCHLKTTCTSQHMQQGGSHDLRESCASPRRVRLLIAHLSDMPQPKLSLLLLNVLQVVFLCH